MQPRRKVSPCYQLRCPNDREPGRKMRSPRCEGGQRQHLSSSSALRCEKPVAMLKPPIQEPVPQQRKSD